MKRQYLKPDTEIVKVRLKGSVLEDPSLHDRSVIAGGMDAKETAFDDFDTEEDIWSGRQTKDVWER